MVELVGGQPLLDGHNGARGQVQLGSVVWAKCHSQLSANDRFVARQVKLFAQRRFHVHIDQVLRLHRIGHLQAGQRLPKLARVCGANQPDLVANLARARRSFGQVWFQRAGRLWVASSRRLALYGQGERLASGARSRRLGARVPEAGQQVGDAARLLWLPEVEPTKDGVGRVEAAQVAGGQVVLGAAERRLVLLVHAVRVDEARLVCAAPGARLTSAAQQLAGWRHLLLALSPS